MRDARFIAGFIVLYALTGFSVARNAVACMSRQEKATKDTIASKKITLKGKVLDSSGAPVAEAEVFLMVPDGAKRILATSRTSSAGGFELQYDSLATELPMAIRARKGTAGTLFGIRVTKKTGEVVLSMTPNALVTLEGKIIEAGTGKPLAAASVDIAKWEYGKGYSTSDDQIKTDLLGKYRFPSLWPDLRYSINVSKQGYSQLYSDTIAVSHGTTQIVPPLPLRKAESQLGGRVVNENGDPIGAAFVGLDGDETPTMSAKTDSEGHFYFTGVVSGERLRVNVQVSGKKNAFESTLAGTTNLIIVVKDEPLQKVTPEPPSTVNTGLLGQAAPQFLVRDWLDTQPLDPKNLQGKVLLIDFWGVASGPCAAKLPAGVARDFAEKGVVTLGLHDSSITPERLRQFAQQKGITYPLAIDTPDQTQPSSGKTFRAFGVSSVPTLVVLDRSGIIRYHGGSLIEAVTVIDGLAP